MPPLDESTAQTNQRQHCKVDDDLWFKQVAVAFDFFVGDWTPSLHRGSLTSLVHEEATLFCLSRPRLAALPKLSILSEYYVTAFQSLVTKEPSLLRIVEVPIARA